jgi:hypothetical protein
VKIEKDDFGEGDAATAAKNTSARHVCGSRKIKNFSFVFVCVCRVSVKNRDL